MKITAKENAKNVRYNITAKKISNTNFRTPSLVDDFYKEVIETKEGKFISYHDPIFMLFNQERLSRIGSASVEAWLESMKKAQNANSVLNELRKQCSDEDLRSLIKSRHLQKPSEIMAWAQYMKQNMDEFNENVRTLAAEKQAEAEKQATEQKKTEVTT